MGRNGSARRLSHPRHVGVGGSTSTGGDVAPGGWLVEYGAVARRLPQTRYAQSTGAKIAYQVSGIGSPNLVLVPGLISHLDLQLQQPAYRRSMGVLERGCRLIRFDKRGTGLSDPVDHLRTIDERVAIWPR